MATAATISSDERRMRMNEGYNGTWTLEGVLALGLGAATLMLSLVNWSDQSADRRERYLRAAAHSAVSLSLTVSAIPDSSIRATRIST